jgi:hypothetical protein
VVAVDFEDAEAGKMEAGSGSLECEGGDCGWWCDSDSGGINSVHAADDTGEVDGKELEERRDMCSGVDADVDGATAARDISSPRGERETGGCDMLVVGVGGACDSGIEVGWERGELGIVSAMNGDNDNTEQLVEERQRSICARTCF